MPGIFGIISKRSNKINEQELDIMFKSANMEHFYNSGKFLHIDMGIYIGWTCYKGSFSDCLPIMNEKKDKILIYFGENFNDIDELDELKRCNHKFNRKNADYIIHMYEEYGEEFLEKLNGCFHGIIIDIQEKKIILFNDRYGMQRIYYFEGKDAFYFSAEAKSILKVQQQVREIEPVSLAELFIYNCVLDNKSLFKEVYLLPGGACWTFCENGKLKKGSYFDPAILESQPLLEKEFHYERLRNTLQNILKRYFKSEDQLGMFLDRDLNCRILLANAQYGPGKLACYTFGNKYEKTYNVRVAEKLADVVNQKLHIINIDDSFFQTYDDLLKKMIYVSEGNMDASGAFELYLNQIAREIAPIRISTNFGGTFLRKEKIIHTNNINNSLFTDEFQDILNGVDKKYSELSSKNLTYHLNKGLSWSTYGELSIMQSQFIVRTPFLDNDFVKLIYRAPDEAISSDKISFRMIRDGNPLLAKAGMKHKNRKLNILFNNDILNIFAPKIKIINYLEKKIVFGKYNKLNYFRIWYQDELSNYLKEILLDKSSTSRIYINKDSIEHIITTHAKGINNYTNEINKLLMAEFVYRLFIED